MNKVYCLRTVDANYQSYKGFQWPKEGLVYAPDWNSNAECGNGLHGLLKGEGNGSLLSLATDAIWQVVEVDADTIINLSGKVKFPSCNVIFVGSKTEAVALIKQKHPEATVVFSSVAVGDHQVAAVGYGGNATAGEGGTATAGYGGTATAGYRGTATAGYYGTATAGEGGTATAGNFGAATAGYYGTATAGYRGTATAGEGGTATAGYGGTATAGYRGTATAGYYGTATAGEGGTATAGNCGTATAGEGGTATAGYGGTATAGNYGCISIKYRGGDRYRIITGNIGEDGLEPNVKYKLDSNHKFIRV